MRIKTSELTGAALDWAVAKCAYAGTPPFIVWNKQVWEPTDYWRYAPSTDWAQGGPIIEREAVTLDYDAHDTEKLWEARHYAFDGTLLQKEFGPTPLIAAMRCYVASKLGDEVDVPYELKE